MRGAGKKRNAVRRGLMAIEYLAIVLLLVLVCLSVIVYIGRSTAGGPPEGTAVPSHSSATRAVESTSAPPSEGPASFSFEEG